jgi:predicted metalloprotease with PDZ domain
MRGIPAILTVPFLLFGTAMISGSSAQSVPQKGDLRYAISYQPLSDRGTLRIEATFRGDQSGQTRLILPSEWGGQDRLYLGISALTVEPAGVVVANTGDPAIRLITHAPGTPLRVTYTVVRDHEDARTSEGRFYRPVLTPDSFFVIGQALWVYPAFDRETPRKIELDWSRLPRGWKSSNSFGIDQAFQKLTVSLEQLRRGVYMSGDYRVLTRTIRGRPVYFATRGTWRFSTDDFLAESVRIIAAQREFFADYDFPFFLVTLFPTDDSPGNMVGEACTQGFTLFVSREQPELRGIEPLFAHEMFHTWNPGRMGGLDKDERLYWFSEGFTEYFSAVLLLRLGIRTPDGHADWLNRAVADYTMSPARNLTADAMVVERRRDGSAERLPYLQGVILAANWDSLLKRSNGRPRDLDEVVRALFQKRREGPLTVERIARVFGARSEEIRQEIDRHIARGETILPRSDALGPQWELASIEKHFFDPGFDLNESFSSKLIVGVRSEGPAAAAGLKNGQRWVSGGMANNPDVEAEIGVDDSAGSHSIRYFPRSSRSVSVPQYRKVSP